MPLYHPESLLMVRPAKFGYNPETALDNAFQDSSVAASAASKAAAEFDHMVTTLEEHNVATFVVQDTLSPATPDSIFPNNWVSFHPDGSIILYPMYAANRRDETTKAVLPTITDAFRHTHITDLRPEIAQARFLEGTGSIIFDHANATAFACYSRRTDPSLFTEVCAALHYTPISFHALDESGKAIYHTNVMMSVGEKFAVVCLESIKDGDERKRVEDALIATHKVIIPISLDQVHHFAGNVLQVYSRDGHPFTLMSQQAYECFTPDQLAIFETYAPPLPVDIHTIEQAGGGSARCMVAEIYLPPR